MTCSIYKITNSINEKVYVGQTWRSLRRRFLQHKLKSSKACVHLYHALNAYGRDNFSIELIALTYNQEDADMFELFYIEQYDSIKNGYNIRYGSSRGKLSHETRKKMSEAAKGRVISEETKKKMSLSATKRKASLETRIKISSVQKGKFVSEETRKKISESRKGITFSEETKMKMSLAAMGNKSAKRTK